MVTLISSVASYVGAWIETDNAAKTQLRIAQVASYVGAWIETFYYDLDQSGRPVASYVGAWIETDDLFNVKIKFLSHPMWVRGLKQLI